VSKTLSDTQLTAHAEQRIRDQLAQAEKYREAADASSESCAIAAAQAVLAMWESLALAHLAAYSRPTFMNDFTRLEARVFPGNAERQRFPPTASTGGRVTLHDASIDVLTRAGEPDRRARERLGTSVCPARRADRPAAPRRCRQAERSWLMRTEYELQTDVLTKRVLPEHDYQVQRRRNCRF
jgi:hypothetical protein